MSYFVVSRDAGPSWIDGTGAFEQPAVNEHAAYMNALANQGVILFAGPVAGSEQERIRVLLIADAGSESEIRHRLADDPWERTGRIVTSTVQPWNVIVGADLLEDRHRREGEARQPTR
jgi:uncharacterized protein YciI